MRTPKSHRSQCYRLSQPSRLKLDRLLGALRRDLYQLTLSAVETAPRRPHWATWASYETFKDQVFRLCGPDAPPELKHRRAAELCCSIFLDELGLIPATPPNVSASNTLTAGVV